MLNRSDESVQYLNWWGYALLERGDYAEAVQRFEIAADISPDNYESWNYLGYCYTYMNREDEARQAYEHAHR